MTPYPAAEPLPPEPPSYTRHLPPAIDALLREKCQAHSVTIDELMSGCRQLQVTAARADCIRALRALGLSLPRIGWVLGLHHTSVLYRLRKPGGKPAPEVPHDS